MLSLPPFVSKTPSFQLEFLKTTENDVFLFSTFSLLHLSRNYLESFVLKTIHKGRGGIQLRTRFQEKNRIKPENDYNHILIIKTFLK